jgi:hypothetical protein
MPAIARRTHGDCAAGAEGQLAAELGPQDGGEYKIQI